MLTILVDSFDGYSDLWPCFFDVFRKQWPDCPYDVKLVSNFKKYDDVDTITVGAETCWTERTLAAVEKVDTEYILLLLEDYLIGSRVETGEVEEAFSFLRKYSGNYLRLTNIPVSRFSCGEKFFPLYEDEEYGVNLQAAIWKKEFLIDSLKRFSGNAWDFEIGFLNMAVKAEHRVLEKCYGMSADPLSIHNGVLKGKWFPREIRYFSARGIDIPWKTRGRLTFAQAAKYNFSVWLKNKMSYTMRKKVKRILTKFGVKFASNL